MAFLLPDNIPSRSGIPTRLRQVARCLKDFTPEHVTVWLRETASGLPYLVVLDPASGIMVVDAPPLSARGRSRRRRGRVFDSFDMIGVPSEIAQQVEVAQQANELKADIDARQIASLPVKHVLAVPDGPDVPREHLVEADLDLPVLTGSDFTESGLLPAVRRILGGERHRALSDQEEKRARAVVNPSIVLPSRASEQLPLFNEPDIAPEDVLRVMDREQERLAEHLRWGYRVIRGVAGSGKTLILVSRARHLHRRWPKLRILVVTFNRVLASALENWTTARDGTAPGEGALLVRNIDRLPFYVAGSFPDERLADGGDTAANDARVQQAVELASRLPDRRRFDVVMVDEAQDLDHLRLTLAYRLLKSSRMDLSSIADSPDGRGHFLRVYDSAQNVLRRRGTTWNPPGVTAQGRTDVLTINYRNTREILELAMTFLAGSGDWRAATVDVEDPAALIPPEAAMRSGPHPLLTACRDLPGEAAVIASLVAELLAEGVSPEDIAVMHGCFELENELTRAFNGELVPYFLVRKDRDGAVAIRGKVRVSTLTKMKGLEFSRVFVCGVNQIRVPDVDEADQFEAAKSQLYAAMTRAMDELEITMSGDGPIGAALREAERLQRVG